MSKPSCSKNKPSKCRALFPLGSSTPSVTPFLSLSLSLLLNLAAAYTLLHRNKNSPLFRPRFLSVFLRSSTQPYWRQTNEWVSQLHSKLISLQHCSCPHLRVKLVPLKWVLNFSFLIFGHIPIKHELFYYSPAFLKLSLSCTSIHN